MIITKNEVFDLSTLRCKSNSWLKNNIRYIIEYLLFMNRLGCTFYLHRYTLSGHKYLQIKFNNSCVLITIRITGGNRKLLKPFLAKSTEDL